MLKRKDLIPLFFAVALGISACSFTSTPGPTPAKTAVAAPVASPTISVVVPTRAALPRATATPGSDFPPSPLSSIFPKIDRQPQPLDWGRGKLATIPVYDPNSTASFQVDLLSYDLSTLDLRGSLDNLLQADFDSQTKWPPVDKLPQGFDWKQVLELGENPGLGVRQLHARGITGRGVGIAVIDQPFLTGHQEYAERLQLYEEINLLDPNWGAQPHGTAVASIALGKTVGVAPVADLYFIAMWPGDEEWSDHFNYNFLYLAQAVRRILEVNRGLPQDRQIRVVAVPYGWAPEQKGYDELNTAIAEANAAGVFVVSSNLEQIYGFKFNGLGRAPLADPDGFESYEPGEWWAKDFYAGKRSSERLLIPMDSRTLASSTGSDACFFGRSGGWSWSIPYIAGIYALAAQVDPTITPERFWSVAMKTGHTIQLKHNGETIPFGPIIDPVALIDKLLAQE